MAFCDNLKRLRDRSGLTQVELAEKMGVGQGLISFWEVGRNLPEASKLPALAKALNCTVDELFGTADPCTQIPKVHERP